MAAVKIPPDLMADLRQSSQYARFMEKTGWRLEKVGSNFLYLRRLPLLPFSVAKLQRPQPPVDFGKLDNLARKSQALLVKVEPDRGDWGDRGKELNKHGYRQSSWIPAVSKTLHLDLTQTEKRILAGMKKDARYSLHRAEKNKLQLNKVVSLTEFYQAWKKAKPPRIWMPPLEHVRAMKESFGKNFLILSVGKPPIAGTIILLADKTAYYYFAFSSSKGKKLFAPYFLVWKGIKEAKKQGMKVFDFEAIEDSRYKATRSFRGFTHFKKSFGGSEVEYPPAYVKAFNPLTSLLARLL